MENLNILSVAGFSFFLLIIVIGYFFVEILLGERYFFRNSIKRNNNSIFDRFLHYFVWGIFINIGFIYLHFYVGNLESFGNIFNISLPLANEIEKYSLGAGIKIQILFFVIFYFIIFSIFSLLSFIVIKTIIFFYKFILLFSNHPINFNKITLCISKYLGNNKK